MAASGRQARCLLWKESRIRRGELPCSGCGEAVAVGVTSPPRACVLAASVPGRSHGTAAGKDWPWLCPPPWVTGSGYPKPSGWKPQQLSPSQLWRPAVGNERVTGPWSLRGRSLPCRSQLLVFAGFLGIPWLVDTPLSPVSVFSCHPACVSSSKSALHLFIRMPPS